jgi:hypothetical protein
VSDLPPWLDPPRPPEVPGRLVTPLTDAERAEQEERAAHRKVIRQEVMKRLREANIKRHLEKIARQNVTPEVHEAKLKAEKARKAREYRARLKTPDRRRLERKNFWKAKNARTP